MTQELIVPKKQRALVFQGGGSLGAYESGVFQALYENITKEDGKKGGERKHERNNIPLFDIVADTSIGVVSYVVENKTWKGSTQKLNEFWDYVSTESYPNVTPGFTSWWDYWHNASGKLNENPVAKFKVLLVK